MNPGKASLLIIINALFFAAAIIISSYLLADTKFEQHSGKVMYFLIALWMIPNTVLALRSKGDKWTTKCDLFYIKQKLAGLFHRG